MHIPKNPYRRATRVKDALEFQEISKVEDIR